MYDLLHWTHAALAALSGIGFLVRGLGRLHGARWLRRRAVRVLPHVVDTLLLSAGIVLAVWSGRSPGDQPWLAAKLLALVVYIGLGLVALRFARSTALVGTAYAGALVCFAYMLAVAVTREVLPWR